jgi:hypothetical protein
MASVIDSHPQRQKIIDAMLNGRTLRDIASSVSPAVSVAALHRYRSGKVAPALKNAAFATKVLSGTDLVDPKHGVSPELEKVVSETSAALAADPFISRVLELRGDRQKVKDLALAGEKPDLKAWVSADRNDLTELELHARLAGRLDSAPKTVNNIAFVTLPGGQSGVGRVIDDLPMDAVECRAEQVEDE